MKKKLFDSFQKDFNNMNKPVREEDILLFLDNRNGGKFDRETYRDLVERMEN